MKRHQLFDIGAGCDLTAGPSSQMTGPSSLIDIDLKKRSFAEKNVSLVRQAGQGCAIGCGIGQIGRIDYFFAGLDGKETAPSSPASGCYYREAGSSLCYRLRR